MQKARIPAKNLSKILLKITISVLKYPHKNFKDNNNENRY